MYHMDRILYCARFTFTFTTLVESLAFVSIIRPRPSQSAVAYSNQTFPWTSVGRSVRLCVRQSVQCIVEKWRIGSGRCLAS